jgi:hypothetical protein
MVASGVGDVDAASRDGDHKLGEIVRVRGGRARIGRPADVEGHPASREIVPAVERGKGLPASFHGQLRGTGALST